ncbi:MAG: hypothetical protein JSR77_18250 [Planctomycetes bacterium]|nr:hypothetical protein [Planctomycetota bacterium]
MPSGSLGHIPPFGQYRPVRDAGEVLLGPGLIARRWIALSDATATNHLVYSLHGCRARGRIRRVLDAAQQLSTLPKTASSHTLDIVTAACCANRGVFLVTEYPGDNVGLVTLGTTANQRRAVLRGAGLRHAVQQIFEAVGFLHENGVCDGSILPERVIIDRRGSLLLELPGLWAKVAGFELNAETKRADVRATMEVCRGLWESCEGSEAEFTEGWRDWLNKGLERPCGYASAAEATAAMPVTRPGVPSVNVVKGLWNRLRGMVKRRKD